MWVLSLLFSLRLATVEASATPANTDCVSFLSRPDLFVPRLDIRLNEVKDHANYYWLFSTWGGACQNAPYIYDTKGHLVWSGYRLDLADMGYFNMKRHELADGSQILSVFRGKSERGRGRGQVVLMDDSYRTLNTIEPETPEAAITFHEFVLLDGGKKAIVIKFQPVQGDLSTVGISRGLGWILDSIFQEIDLRSGEILFEWRARDHVSLNESVVPPVASAGAGRSSFVAFDYFHMNSVDKFSNGDYLVSARHTDTIYRISAHDGSIRWRMPGHNFSTRTTTITTVRASNFTFSAQHDARILSEDDRAKTTRISFLNNAWNGMARTRDISSAMVVELDDDDDNDDEPAPPAVPTAARLVEERFPARGGLARHQGTVQTLPNGHMFVSWGGVAEFSEFTPAGQRVADVAFADERAHVYRVEKHLWKGAPDTVPDVYLYARNETARTHFYVSWNGATEVVEWAVYAVEGRGGSREEVRLLGKVEKAGFETHFESPEHVSAGVVEALDRDGEVLARSDVQSAVVPPESLTDVCGDAHCTIQQVIAEPNPEDMEKEVNTGWVLTRSRMGCPMRFSNGLIQALIMAAAGFFAGKFSQTLFACKLFGRRPRLIQRK